MEAFGNLDRILSLGIRARLYDNFVTSVAHFCKEPFLNLYVSG